MAAERTDDIAREMTRLHQAIDAIVSSASDPDLPAIRTVLTRAVAAVESIGTRHAAGAYVVDVPDDRMRVYFPHRVGEGRLPTAPEMEHAAAGWMARRAVGHRLRDEAVAQLGPVVAASDAAGRLRVTAATVNDWRRKGRLLGLRLDGHQYLYPAFQFVEGPVEGKQAIVRDLHRVLVVLNDRTAWEKAQYLITPWPYLKGRTPIDILRDSASSLADRDRVVDYAHHAGEMGV